MAAVCRTAWLVWPVSVAVMSRVGRYLPYGVAALARIAGRYEPCWPSSAVRSGCSGRIGGRYDPCWPLFAVWRGCSRPYRWPLWPVLAAACRMVWLLWPVSVAVMSRVARYLPHGVAVLARVGGRYEPCCHGCPFLRSLRFSVSLPFFICWLPEVAVLARVGGRNGLHWLLAAACGGCSGPYRWPV